MDASVIHPGWLSLIPPLAAIVMALVFREVVISLFTGVWLGALFLAHFHPLTATLRTVDTYLVETLAGEDPAHVSIVFFSLLLGGMVGVISRSGGVRGMMEKVGNSATTARRGQLYAGLAGLLIFFDDYTNALIVGNTLRPVTDRVRVSREKLSYIVDTTAAPVASVALISTWVGFQISLIGDTLRHTAADMADPVAAAALTAAAANPFTIFLHTIPYLFYPILTVVFVFLLAATGRDFGPMFGAEARAARGDGVYRAGATLAGDTSGGVMDPPEDRPHRWWNAAIPVLLTVVVAVVGIYATGVQSVGADAGLRQIVGAGDPYRSLLWASSVGSAAAIALAVAQRVLSLQAAVDAWVGGMRVMMVGMIILILAWALGGVTQKLGTGPYLAALLGDTLPVHLLPVLTFGTAALISFATGTSWGTMSILFPVSVPLAAAMGAGAGFGTGDHYTILLGVIAAILAGSVFGDHSSPISDTTVLSSMASASDHVDHFRTQLPYALVVAVVAMLVGDIPAAYGLHPAIGLAAGALLLFLILRAIGKPIPTDVGPAAGAWTADPERGDAPGATLTARSP